MRRAQWLVDVGPDAGEQGGNILYSGVPQGLSEISASRTASYLFNRIPVTQSYGLHPLVGLNLTIFTDITCIILYARIPLGVLTAVTGISGSGKSSLVSQALPKLVLSYLGNESEKLKTIMKIIL